MNELDEENLADEDKEEKKDEKSPEVSESPKKFMKKHKSGSRVCSINNIYKGLTTKIRIEQNG